MWLPSAASRYKPGRLGVEMHPLPWAPLPIFLAGARIPSRVTRLPLREEERTRVEALVEGGGDGCYQGVGAGNVMATGGG